MIKKIHVFTLFLLVILTLLSGCTVPQWTFEYAGAKDPVIVPKSTYTSVLLVFQVNIGSITLEVNPTATYLAYIENEVSIRKGSGGTLADAEEVSYTELPGGTMRIKFAPQTEAAQEDYSYNITIKVANNITLEIDLQTVTGSISTNIADSSITIPRLDLETTTGSISLELKDIKLSDPSPTVTTTTGDHVISLWNVDYPASMAWSIKVTTGEVKVGLTETQIPSSVSMILGFDVECTTGDIAITADISLDFGLAITASTTTGTITIPGGENTYTSTNYDSVARRYDFDLMTTTGSITVNYQT